MISYGQTFHQTLKMAARLSVQSLWFSDSLGTARAASRAGRSPGYQTGLQQHPAFKGSSQHHLPHSEDRGSVDIWPLTAAASLPATPEDNHYSLEHTKIEDTTPCREQETVHPGLLSYHSFQGGRFPWQCSLPLLLDHRWQIWLSFYNQKWVYMSFYKEKLSYLYN